MKSERGRNPIVKSDGAQVVVPLRERRRPQVVSRLLTGADAMARFGFPHYHALYGFVEDEGITVYTVGKRDLYPERELEQALARANAGLASAAISTGGQNGAISASAKIEDGSKVGKPSLVQFRRRLFKNAA